jgi:hypothetical protein
MYQLMAKVMSELALFLVQQPINGHELAAPTFEIFEFGSEDREAELVRLSTTVAELHPQLADVKEAIVALRS